MNAFRWQTILWLGVFLAAAPEVYAQQQQRMMMPPHVGYVYPAGGRQGTTFEVTVGGQYLEGVNKVYVSGDGVKVSVGKFDRPLTIQEANKLRDKLQDAQKRLGVDKKDGEFAFGRGGPMMFMKLAKEAGITEEDLRRMAEFRQSRNDPKRQVNPQIAETVILKVTLAADASPGDREVRLTTAAGLSNPQVFRVGKLPEFTKKPATTRDESTSGKRAFFNKEGKSGDTPPTETKITLPAVVNGQIMPGGVDRFRFKARKGEHLVIVTSARELIPYLADAVPGWFQAMLTLYDAKGQELNYADHYLFHPDPVLYYDIPEDGEYMAEIRDSIYRGREDFVYRITFGEQPFVTSFFPLGGQSGTRTNVEIKGWNLPVTTLTPSTKGPGIYPLSVRNDKWTSNRVPFQVDTLSECLEEEPNNDQASAQAVRLPIVVNGRIDRPGDLDVFRIEGVAGEKIVAEVHARRLNSPLDSMLQLTDADGKQLAFNDDHEDKGSGLNTHHADSLLSFTLPTKGTYFLYLSDAQHQGGPEYGYRLRISRPRPNFELRVVPSSINVRGGGSVPITVYALREDGFSDEIALSLKNVPEGFTLSGAKVPARQDQVRFTLSVPPVAVEEPLSLVMEGRAKIQGREVVRQAVPAEDMMQAFAYRHLVPTKGLKIVVPSRNMGRGSIRVLDEGPVKIPVGGTARVRVGLPTDSPYGKIHLELSEPPEGISVQDVSSSGRGSEIVLRSDAKKTKLGLKGNLIVNILIERSPSSNKDKKPPPGMQRRFPIGTLPAIPFEIVAASRPASEAKASR